MSTPVENLERWIAALRSGKYEQGRMVLRNNNWTFCCLGVACDTLDPSKWRRGGFYGGLNTTLDTPTSAQFGLTLADRETLIHANDIDRADFSDIADYIERNILPRVRSEQEKVQS